MGTIEWLTDSDPGIRWQVMRDLLGEPEEHWRPVRAAVETEGWGARLLAHQDPDGQWDGGAFFPGDFTEEKYEQEGGQPWTATAHALDDLRELGLDPECESARRTVDLVGRNSRWDAGGLTFWEGETEECINGRTVSTGVYFGVDMAPLVDRLVGERQDDGGWNCERENGSLRSSYHSTINVVEGLLAFEMATGGTPASREARLAGEEYLLSRGLFRRLATGEPADPDFWLLRHPDRWHYSVLRGLDHLRQAASMTGDAPDARLEQALDDVRARRGDDGRWPLEVREPGRVWFRTDDEVGEPSRWVTLRALRVLAWADR